MKGTVVKRESIEISAADYQLYWRDSEVPVLSKIKFGISYLNTTIRSLPPTSDQVSDSNWHEFDLLTGTENNGIYLGCLPHKQILREIARRFSLVPGDRKGLIVACVDYFELAGSGTFTEVATPSEFAEHNIDHHQLIMHDFNGGNGINHKLVLETLAKIKEYRDQQLPVYIHCKAGRSRSGLVAVLAVMQEMRSSDIIEIKQQGAQITLVHDHIKRLRKQLDVGKGKLQVGQDIVSNYFNIGEQSFTKPGYASATEETPSAYFKSAKFVSKVVQTNGFKSLMMYLAKNTSNDKACVQAISEFFDNLLIRGDASLYSQLFEAAFYNDKKREDGLSKFINSKPWHEAVERFTGIDDGRVERRRICMGLYDDIDKLIPKSIKAQLKAATKSTTPLEEVVRPTASAASGAGRVVT